MKEQISKTDERVTLACIGKRYPISNMQELGFELDEDRSWGTLHYFTRNKEVYVFDSYEQLVWSLHK